MMALEAVGAGIEDLLQDAVVRQRALNDYEKEQQDALRRFEETKAEEKPEAAKRAGEPDRASYMARVQANADEVAREQDKFRAWQRKKQQESQQIAEAAAFCVPDGLGPHGGSLASVLERAAGCAPVGVMIPAVVCLAVMLIAAYRRIWGKQPPLD